MSTKMKGLLKGLRYISQIFDEEKDNEIEIGFPTDVKHVAHIGWDGPSVDSPSWMKEFKSPTSFQSAPLGNPGDSKENPEVKWVSEDGKSGRGKNSSKEQGGGGGDAPRSSRRNSSNGENSSDSPKKERPRSSRKQHSKDSSDSVKSTSRQLLQDPTAGSDSPSRSLPDIPKKTRRKKSKDASNGGSSGSVRSRMKSADASGICTSDSGQLKSKKKDDISRSSNLKPDDIEEEEKEISGIF